MVLEQLLRVKFLEKHCYLSIFLGFFYTIIAAITSYIFFGKDLSLPMFFIISLLLVPTLLKLLSFEEKIESKDGTRHFFKDHKKIFETYVYISIGIFIAYLIIMGFFSFQGYDVSEILNKQVEIFGESIDKEKIISFEVNKLEQFLGIFTENLKVSLIFFILSIFFGAGAIFLIVWNVSIFSSFVFMFTQNLAKGITYSISLLGSFALYIIPEIAGFLLAAIAGGVLSKAVIEEKLFSKKFKNVLQDSILLLILSLILLLIAAFFESFIVTDLIKTII